MSNNRVVLIVIDALKYETACSHLGFMHHLVEQKMAARYKVQAETPALSRPLYETILTGTSPIDHGVVSNQTNRLSTQKSLFHLVRQHGRKTAAAAYYWISELYNRSPFQLLEDRIQLDQDKPIENGLFYFEDSYPDTHLFTDALWLLQQKQPDFLYVHPMNVDYAGHLYGGDSKEYRNQVLVTDACLSHFIPQCLALDYDVIVTADHGMTDDGNHGGTSIADREVPMFIISKQIKPMVHEEMISQLQLAPIVCRLLAIEPSAEMETLNIKGIS